MTCNPDVVVRRFIAASLLFASLAAPASGSASLLERSAAALRGGHVSQARALAKQAVDSAPSGAAHVLAAETALAEGDGITAEGEISRATDAGVDARTTRHLFAHARLLQGDANGALVAARQADARHQAYGQRIQARALAATGDVAGAATLWANVTSRHADDAAVWVDYGAFLATTGDQAGAVAAADRALALAPASLDALLLRANLSRGGEGLAVSLPRYRAALARDPNSYAALIELAATLGDMGRAEDMLRTTRRALAIRPGDSQACYLLAVLAARAGNARLARSLFDRTGDAYRGVPAGLLFGATLDIRSGDLEQAVSRLRNLIALQPMNLRARQLLALALLKLGAATDALEVLRPIALRDDADSYTLLLSARGFEMTGNRAEATRLLGRANGTIPGAATIFAPDSSVAVTSAAVAMGEGGELATAVPLIRALLGSGDSAGAVARARAVAGAHPGVPEAAVLLGDTLLAANRASEAIAAFRRAATLRFDEPTMLRLTRALEAGGDGAGAGAVLLDFLRRNPANVTARRMVARGQIAGGDPEGAIDTLERLRARLGNRDAALLADLAQAYGAAGAWQAAADDAGAAYRLMPMRADLARLYGWALQGAGDRRAAALFDKARRLAS